MEIIGAIEASKLKECTAVVVGRFQVPELHEGHLHLLNIANNMCGQLVVVLGSGERISERDPYPYHLRKKMILNTFPKASIHGIFDYPTNEQWSGVLDAIVYTYPSVILFGSRDCFMKDYIGENKCMRVPEIPGVSGTKIRKQHWTDFH